jgi:hypothetical protein
MDEYRKVNFVNELQRKIELNFFSVLKNKETSEKVSLYNECNGLHYWRGIIGGVYKKEILNTIILD